MEVSFTPHGIAILLTILHLLIGLSWALHLDTIQEHGRTTSSPETYCISVDVISTAITRIFWPIFAFSIGGLSNE